MDIKKFYDLQFKASSFVYDSLNYIDEEDIENVKVVRNDDDGIICEVSYSNERYVFFACNEFSNLNEYFKNEKDIRVSFIPKSLIGDFESLGYKVDSIYFDFFYDSVLKSQSIKEFIKYESIRKATINNVKDILVKTDYENLNEEELTSWVNKEGSKEDTILLDLSNDEIKSFALVGPYTTESEKALWIKDFFINIGDTQKYEEELEKLLKNVMIYAKEIRCDYIEANINVKDNIIEKAFKNLGFVKGEGVAQITMTK